MSLYHKWLAKIQENEKQWEAFQKAGHTVVIAGPGSGKTRVLAVKIAQLLREEINTPRGLACLTYTRMMAKELETRLKSLGVLDRPNVIVGTVHSFCLGQVVYPFSEVFGLGIPQPIRIAPTRVWNLSLDQARRKVSGVGYNPDEDQSFKTTITKYHIQRTDISFEEWENQEYAQILQSHYQLLREQGYVDFDIIVKAALNLIANQDLVRQSLYAKFAWLAVDEYRNCSGQRRDKIGQKWGASQGQAQSGQGLHAIFARCGQIATYLAEDMRTFGRAKPARNLLL